jgi:hypothetical protein
MIDLLFWADVVHEASDPNGFHASKRRRDVCQRIDALRQRWLTVKHFPNGSNDEQMREVIEIMQEARETRRIAAREDDSEGLGAELVAIEAEIREWVSP